MICTTCGSAADKVLDVAVVPAPPHQAAQGLLGYATLIVGGWRISGVRLRRSAKGDLYVCYPEHGGDGAREPYVLPLEESVRGAIAAAVIAAWTRSARLTGRVP